MVSAPVGRGILILSAFVKEALLRYKIKLLFFFSSFLNGTNQLNTVKDAVEKLLCNFRKPQNPDPAVELPQGVSPDLCVGSGRGRGWRGTHCPSNLCQKPPDGGPQCTWDGHGDPKDIQHPGMSPQHWGVHLS